MDDGDVATTEKEMIVQAVRSIIDSNDFVSLDEIGRLPNAGENLKEEVLEWTRDQRLFSLAYEGAVLFPRYGFDPTSGYRPYPVMKDVIAVLGRDRDEWGIAFWFMADNSWLGGRRPRDLLSSEPGKVARAAKVERLGIRHG